MRRFYLFVTLFAFVAIAPPLQAQIPDSTSSTRQLSPLPAGNALNIDPSSTRTYHPSFLRRLITGLGAAIAGAYVGYFFSEVAQGDWHQTVNGKFLPPRNPPRRGLWAGAGGALGFALGFSFPIGPKHKAPAGPLPALPPGLPMGRSMLSAKEIAGSKAKTAYGAVQDLRPQWLPGNVAFVSARVSVPFQSDIPVYEDSTRIGGLQQLAQVPVTVVEAMYRLDLGQAMSRFGASDPNGAILIITKH